MKLNIFMLRLVLPISLGIFSLLFICYYSQPTNPDLLSYWPNSEGKLITEKVYPYPIHRKKIQIKNEFEENVDLVPHYPSEEFLGKIINEINRIPLELTQVVNKNLMGIFLTENIPSTGFADIATGYDGKIKFFIVLNCNKIKFSTNEWATNKVASAFAHPDNRNIQITLDESDDNNTLLAILIHEFSHVYAWENQIVPIEYWRANPNLEYSFMDISWSYTPLGSAEYKFGKDKIFSEVEYYSDIPHDHQKNPLHYYQRLSESTFSTLYSTYDYQEDFSEALFMYYWVHVFNKPYEVKVENQIFDLKHKFLSSEKFQFISRLLLVQ